MTFLTPLGLIALLGIPTVLLLHLFRQRRKKRAVSGIFLFGGDITVVESGRQPLPLEATASLILELLAALLLALILSGLSCRGEPDHVVIVLDQSASMGALTPSGSIADAARTEALRVVAETGRSVRVSLVLTGKAPVVAVGPRALAPLLEPALQRYEPTAVHHAMAPALELARQTASPGTPIVLITDTAPESPIPGVAVHAVGTPLANAAIRSAFRSVGPAGREHVIVDVGGTSPGNAVVRTRVAILSGEGVAATPLAARDVLVPRGGAATVSIEVTASPKALTVRLSPDALAIDNTALLLPIETRLLTVQDELPEAFSK
ncbi:MAG: VWA domain-containing protein, partial [Planctomycetota bacterium]